MVDVSGVLEQYQRQLSGGALSIPDLIAAGTSSVRHGDSDDDDYD